MKKIIIIIVMVSFLTLFWTACQNSQGSNDNDKTETKTENTETTDEGDDNSGIPKTPSTPETYNDTFNQNEWETDVTVSVNYADFTVGTWIFRKVNEEPDGNKKITIGEFKVLHDITGYSDKNEDLQYIKIAEFENDGKNYSEYDEKELNLKNSSSSKLYLLNRSSCGPLDTSKDEWSKSTVLYANTGKSKFKSYTEEWASNGKNSPFAIYKTTYFFEKKM